MSTLEWYVRADEAKLLKTHLCRLQLGRLLVVAGNARLIFNVVQNHLQYTTDMQVHTAAKHYRKATIWH